MSLPCGCVCTFGRRFTRILREQSDALQPNVQSNLVDEVRHWPRELVSCACVEHRVAGHVSSRPVGLCLITYRQGFVSIKLELLPCAAVVAAREPQMYRGPDDLRLDLRLGGIGTDLYVSLGPSKARGSL